MQRGCRDPKENHLLALWGEDSSGTKHSPDLETGGTAFFPLEGNHAGCCDSCAKVLSWPDMFQTSQQRNKTSKMKSKREKQVESNRGKGEPLRVCAGRSPYRLDHVVHLALIALLE